jgi:streptomycin 6-kinase
VNRSVHPGLEWLRGSPEGLAWLERLPGLVDSCAERWSLRLGEPYAYAYASLALRAELPDGTRAVLKVQFPDRESEHEAAALELWDGYGAVRLLAYDAEQRAEYLPGSWERAGRPFERMLLEAALEAIANLSGSQGEQVLVHQDLHAGNVLRAERELWLAIDPKPLAGEREFGIAALVRGDELGRGPKNVRHRLDRLTADLDLDRDRARGWALAQTIAWSFDGEQVFPDLVETARWLLQPR